jgi:hypothetical protein
MIDNLYPGLLKNVRNQVCYRKEDDHLEINEYLLISKEDTKQTAYSTTEQAGIALQHLK